MIRSVLLGLALTFQVSPPFRQFDVDESALIAVRSANGVGKTRHLCKKIADRAIRNPHSHHRIVGPTRNQVRQVSGRYLWEFLEPYCDPRSVYYEGTGWNRNGIILLKNKSTIELLAYEDKPQGQEGRHDLMTIGLDEVPKQRHYMANKGRSKQLIITFTVQTKAPPEWLRKEIEGPPEGRVSPTEGREEHSTGWVQYVIPFLRHNVPFYEEETYQLKVSKYMGTEEEARRIWAAWDSPSEERTFTGYSVSIHRSSTEILDMLRNEKGQIVAEARWSHDWGEGHKLYGYLTLYSMGRFFVTAEVKGQEKWTPLDFALAFKEVCEDWLGPWPMCLYRLKGCFGDINSSGPAGAGDSLNLHFERAILSLCPGWTELPWHVQAPSKRPGFKDSREIACNHKMIQGQWFVNEECENAIKAYKMYEGGERDPWKDPIDGQLYGVQDLLLVDRATGDYQIHR